MLSSLRKRIDGQGKKYAIKMPFFNLIKNNFPHQFLISSLIRAHRKEYYPILSLAHIGVTQFMSCLNIAFNIKVLDALSVGDGRKKPIPSLLPSQHHYLKSYTIHIKNISTDDNKP